MKTTGRLVVLAVAATLLAGACTGAKGKQSASPSSTSPSAPPTIVAPPGTAVYLYANTGLVATLELKGDQGTLSIQNKTGRDLPPPSFYLLAGTDGHRVEGSVEGATDVPDGQTMKFKVSFTGLDPKNIGLAVLLMGQDNYGAFVRQ